MATNILLYAIFFVAFISTYADADDSGLCKGDFNDDIIVKQCSRQPGSRCDVCCKDNKILLLNHPIMCLTNGSWSEMPKCLDSKCCSSCSTCLTNETSVDFRQRCRDVKLPDAIAFVPASCKASNGKFCKVGCMATKYVKGKKSNYVTGIRRSECLGNGEWSRLPDCTTAKSPDLSCLLPITGKNIIVTSECTGASGEKCSVECEKGYELVSSNIIECKDKNWSPSPICKVISFKKCPEVIDENLSLLNCTRMPNSQCEVRCNDGMALIGPTYINCSSNGEWTEIPRCEKISFDPKLSRRNCKTAKMPENVVFQPPSCKTSKKYSCKVGCKIKTFNGYDNPIKVVFLSRSNCLPTGEWSNVPNCTEAKQKYWNDRINPEICPVSIEEKNLIIPENCSRLPGSKCIVTCVDGYDMIGTSTIECRNKTWSSLPHCETKLCSDLEESGISSQNCSRFPNSFCEVGCKDGKRLVGNSTIECLPSRTWSSIPQCMFDSNTPFSSFDVALNLCKITKVPENIVFEPKTCKRSGKTTCMIGCRIKVFNENADEMKTVYKRKSSCLPTGEWSNMPNCTAARYRYWVRRIQEHMCPLPETASHAVLSPNCTRMPGSHCTVSCGEEYQLVGSDILTCQNRSWSPIPTCKLNEAVNCPIDLGNSVQLKNCSGLPNSKCTASCFKGETLLGPKDMTCSTSGSWLEVSQCIDAPRFSKKTNAKALKKCQKMAIPPKVEFQPKKCQKSGKKICKAGCRTDVFTEGAEEVALVDVRKIACLPSGVWSYLPNCTAAQYEYWDRRIAEVMCPAPEPMNNVQIAPNCSRMPGQSCEVSCKEGFSRVGPENIKCENREWSPFPNCIVP